MFEVKRKPNSSGGFGSATSAATRAYAQPAASELATEPSVINVATPLPQPLTGPKLGPPIIAKPVNDGKTYQTRLPMITGEAQYNGTLRLDGMATGQLGASGGTLSVKQRTRPFFNEPEFFGEVSFRDMIRVNGHIGGTVYSKTGTLIVDISARVDASVDVAVAVIKGTVHGDIIARQRVEIGPNAKIYGNIWTRSIEIKNGAIFEGVCTMIAEEQIAG